MPSVETTALILIPLVILGAVAYELRIGRILGIFRGRIYDRHENPQAYWATIGAQVVAAVFGIVLGIESLGTERERIVDEPEERKLLEAQQLQREKKWPDAHAAFDELALKMPQDPRPFYGRGVANRNLGKPDAALADFRQVIALDSSHYPSWVEVDRILSARKRWDEVIALWDGYLSRYPTKAEAWYERAGTRYHMGDLAAAKADATKACELGLEAACRRVQRLEAGK